MINKNLFVNTNTFDCKVILAKNGKVICTEALETAVEPLSTKEYKLPFGKAEAVGEYTVTVSSNLKKEKVWASAGHEIAFGQYVYQVKEDVPDGKSDSAETAITTEKRCMCIRCVCKEATDHPKHTQHWCPRRAL